MGNACFKRKEKRHFQLSRIVRRPREEEGINDEWAAERVKKEKLEEKPLFLGGEARYGNGVCCWWGEEENGRERNGIYRTVVRKLKSELLFQKRQNTKAYCGTTNTEKAAAGSSRSV